MTAFNTQLLEHHKLWFKSLEYTRGFIFLFYFIFLRNIERLATVTLTEKFVPLEAGPQKLLASLDCRQLPQVHGVANIVVKANWIISSRGQSCTALELQWLWISFGWSPSRTFFSSHVWRLFFSRKCLKNVRMSFCSKISRHYIILETYETKQLNFE